MKCILIEYETEAENRTYELFDNIEEAFKFGIKNKKHIKRIDLVEANNTFYEDDKTLNYEDFSNTIEQGVISEVY